MAEVEGVLTRDEYMSPQGCGVGTENACYALSMGVGGMVCSIAAKGNDAVNWAGIMLGWRMNIDPVDGTPWCPKGIIPGSKTNETC